MITTVNQQKPNSVVGPPPVRDTKRINPQQVTHSGTDPNRQQESNDYQHVFHRMGDVKSFNQAEGE